MPKIPSPCTVGAIAGGGVLAGVAVLGVGVAALTVDAGYGGYKLVEWVTMED